MQVVKKGAMSLYQCLAQSSGTGRLNGTITDASGAVIPAVQVTARQLSTGLTRTTATNSSGFYSLPALRAGEYQIEATAAGFQRTLQNGVVLQSNTTRAINMQLAIGQVTDSATISATPSAIEISEGSLSTIVSGTQLNDLALNGRAMASSITGIKDSPSSFRLSYAHENVAMNPSIRL